MLVPVSTAATERSHSELQIVKTKLQSTMGTTEAKCTDATLYSQGYTVKLSKYY